MQPKVGDKVTYVDEGGHKNVATVTASGKQTGATHSVISIEYKRKNNSKGTVTSIMHLEDSKKIRASTKVCYTSDKPKESKADAKKPDDSKNESSNSDSS